MDKLHSYVSAIHKLSSAVSIARQEVANETWLDQGFEVRKSLTTYWFDNGVVIRQSVEMDYFPSDLACSECWISYEVMAQGDLVDQVSPARKVFANACRESFWLAYHRA